MRISMLQMNIKLNSPRENFAHAEELVRKAALQHPDVITLPETWTTGFAPEGNIGDFADQDCAQVRETFSALAKELHVNIIAGSVVNRKPDGHLYNTACVFDREGKMIAQYDKVHLYSPAGEDKTFRAGNSPCNFTLDGVPCSLVICYDIRFPELFRAMAVRGAKLIFLPAQFNMKTGPAHWDMSLRMRAVDNEVFVAGASAARYDGFSYECWGHSAVADPFGELIAQCDEKEQILYADINLDRVEEVRASLPTFNCLRRDVYTVAD